MTKRDKLITTMAVCSTMATVVAFGTGVKKDGIPVHHDTRAIEDLTEDGTVVKITNASDGPVNSHVKDPDNRPTGTSVPDGPTAFNP